MAVVPDFDRLPFSPEDRIFGHPTWLFRFVNTITRHALFVNQIYPFCLYCNIYLHLYDLYKPLDTVKESSFSRPPYDLSISVVRAANKPL